MQVQRGGRTVLPAYSLALCLSSDVTWKVFSRHGDFTALPVSGQKNQTNVMKLLGVSMDVMLGKCLASSWTPGEWETEAGFCECPLLVSS